jgi:hypothetical protein
METKIHFYPNALYLYRFALYISSTKSLLSKTAYDATPKIPEKLHLLRCLANLNSISKTFLPELQSSADIHKLFPSFNFSSDIISDDNQNMIPEKYQDFSEQLETAKPM